MSEQIQSAFGIATECVDARSLSERLGPADELTTLSPTACTHHLTKVHSLPALREFLAWYKQDILAPHELRHAWQSSVLAARGHARELLALDAELAKEPALRDFQLASRHVGKRQLNRMRALKDLRVVQRYLQAVNAGEAYGWHTLVYGVVLATYSLPARQGLLHYGGQTLGGFIHAAARTLDLRPEDCLQLQIETAASLPALVDHAISLTDDSASLFKQPS